MNGREANESIRDAAWLAKNRRPYWNGPDHVYLDHPELAEPEPTTARPGTAAKIAALADRLQDGQDLWHPDDAQLSP